MTVIIKISHMFWKLKVFSECAWLNQDNVNLSKVYSVSIWLISVSQSVVERQSLNENCLSLQNENSNFDIFDVSKILSHPSWNLWWCRWKRQFFGSGAAGRSLSFTKRTRIFRYFLAKRWIDILPPENKYLGNYLIKLFDIKWLN